MALRVISRRRSMVANSIGCTLLQFGHHTFGKRLVSSSIAQNLGACPTARYLSRIHSMPFRASLASQGPT